MAITREENHVILRTPLLTHLITAPQQTLFTTFTIFTFITFVITIIVTAIMIIIFLLVITFFFKTLPKSINCSNPCEFIRTRNSDVLLDELRLVTQRQQCEVATGQNVAILEFKLKNEQ